MSLLTCFPPLFFSCTTRVVGALDSVLPPEVIKLFFICAAFPVAKLVFM